MTPNEGVRQAAVEALNKLDPAALAASVDALVQKLAHDSSGTRRAALELLVKTEPEHLSRHAATIVQQLDDDGVGVIPTNRSERVG